MWGRRNKSRVIAKNVLNARKDIGASQQSLGGLRRERLRRLLRFLGFRLRLL
jgi:hypothetical protein